MAEENVPESGLAKLLAERQEAENAKLAAAGDNALEEEKVERQEVEEGAASVSTRPEAPAIKYQHYHCARSSMKMLTKRGTPIVFVLGEFITNNPEIIDYLNEEISLGLTMVTKGELLSHEEANPMSALRRKIIKEYEEKKAADEALAASTDEALAAASTGILGSADVVTAGESASGDS